MRRITRCPAKDLEDEYAGLLRSCGDARALPQGRSIHASIWEREDLRKSTFLGNLLIEMYGKCGAMEDARGVFDRILQPNVFSWNLLLQACAHNGQLHSAQEVFYLAPQHSVVSWTSMMVAFAQNGSLQEAKSLFEGMSERSLISWSAMLAAFAQSRHLLQAWSLFEKMPERNALACNAMITAYAEHGYLWVAVELFNNMADRTCSSWNAVTAAYAQLGHLQEAEAGFNRMPERNVVSWTTMLTGFASAQYVEEARELFHMMPERNIVSWNALISCFEQQPEDVFNRMTQHNVVSWNALIAAYSRSKNPVEARRIFDQMPNTLLPTNNFMPSKDGDTWITMVTSYCQSGLLPQARQLLNSSTTQNCNWVAWNVLVAAYAQHGHLRESLELLRELQLDGIQPDELSLLSILASCSHSGQLAEAREVFVSSISDHELVPSLESYCCIIDILGRAGKLSAAEELIDSMPFLPDTTAWKILLSASRTHGDASRAQRAASRLVELNPEDPTSYILLSQTKQPVDPVDHQKLLV